ncbi:CHAT domain containing protein [Lactarius tabidus]
MANQQSKSEYSRRLSRLSCFLYPLPVDSVGPTISGPIHEIAADISQSQQLLLALHHSHPLRLICASRLAGVLFESYLLLNQKDDLVKTILYLTESLLSPTHSWLAHGQMMVNILFFLALSLFERSRVSKKPEDAICAAKYLRHIHNPVRAPFAFLRQPVTALLVATLEFQMELKASDVVQTLVEMAVLTHELLTSDPSSANTTSAIAHFVGALSHKLPLPFPDQPLNQIIKCLRLARMHKPEMREVHFLLAKCLYFRYYYTMNDELDEATSILDEVIASSSPRDEFIARCQDFVANLAMLRSMVDDHPENSEEAIYRARAFLASSSVEDVLYPTWSQVLDRAAKNRFENFGPIDGLEAPSSDSLSSRLVIANTSKPTRPLDGLLSGMRSNDITDIGEAIELGRTILASSNPSDMDVPELFGVILFEAFKRTNKIEYLDESIDTLRQLLARPSPSLLRFAVLVQLFNSLFTRAEISPDYYTQDLREVIELLPQFLNIGSEWLSLPNQFQYACIWVYFAQAIRHPSISTAYETAFSLMQDALFFAPTLQLQHTTLVALPAYSHEMPLGYTSYLVELGQLEQAIETLERGRALLWSEMRHLRIPIDQILKADPDLGDKFAAVNRDLEELTKSIPPSHELSLDDVISDDLRAGDQFGSLLRRQRGLLKKRDKLISQIRSLPGFDRFLTPPLFDTLRPAASSGPVIIINHSEQRSHILILLHTASPSLIRTPADFYHRANALKDKLLGSRTKDGLDSRKYDETLATVLAELCELIGKPVIERLRQLQVPKQSRIWWCPTSVFCSLPLHAMGPIPSDEGERQYFLDLYICSYTPSLSALIQSRNRNSGSRSSDRPSVLLVAQTDPSLPTVGGEIQVVRALDTKVTSLISEAATPAAVLDGFRHHRFVHFACHGTLEAGKPFEAGFELHGDERLTLLEIVRSDLPTAEFAFLSACHTAEVTEGSAIDEGLHLAAAVQYSGFRSVVGTMWAMVDEDGRDLAENFYKALFSDSRREQGTPYYERSAKALRFAVKKLRKKRRITLERWVNFVHYGA